ncbi:MAG: Hin recombinase [Clostridia bacterium]|nr:Hin recombinase [Clostridia bacterium]
MNVDYRELCIRLFGTDDVNELEKIAKKNKTGRKKSLSDKDIKEIIDMQQQGKTTQEIAQFFGVSRQTVSKYLNAFPKGNFTMRMNYMFRQKVCTEIYVDFLNRKIFVINRTNDILRRAFGVKTNPTWEDFEDFLLERCFSAERGNKKEILNALGVDSFDPLRIVEATNGRMAEDNQYINFVYESRRMQ